MAAAKGALATSPAKGGIITSPNKLSTRAVVPEFQSLNNDFIEMTESEKRRRRENSVYYLHQLVRLGEGKTDAQVEDMIVAAQRSEEERRPGGVTGIAGGSGGGGGGGAMGTLPPPRKEQRPKGVSFAKRVLNTLTWSGGGEAEDSGARGVVLGAKRPRSEMEGGDDDMSFIPHPTYAPDAAPVHKDVTADHWAPAAQGGLPAAPPASLTPPRSLAGSTDPHASLLLTAPPPPAHFSPRPSVGASAAAPAPLTGAPTAQHLFAPGQPVVVEYNGCARQGTVAAASEDGTQCGVRFSDGTTSTFAASMVKRLVA